MAWSGSGAAHAVFHSGNIRDAFSRSAMSPFIKSLPLRMRYTDKVLMIASSASPEVARCSSSLAAIALLVCAYVWILPWTAERLAMVVPQEVDERMRETAYQQMAFAFEEDAERTQHLQEFGDQLNCRPVIRPSTMW